MSSWKTILAASSCVSGRGTARRQPTVPAITRSRSSSRPGKCHFQVTRDVGRQRENPARLNQYNYRSCKNGSRILERGYFVVASHIGTLVS